MKIVIMNGSPRKGNTYAAAQLFKDEMKNQGEVEFIEFFLPKDMPEFCVGCMSCFNNGENTCPHAKYTLPILDALINADGFLFTTPVYVMQTSGAMKALLDHFGFMFMVHRAKPEMFGKKAFILSTTAGAGTKAAIKTIFSSLKYWGVNRIYSLGFSMFAPDWKTMKPNRKEKIENNVKKAARHFYWEVYSGKRHSPYITARFMFYICRTMIKGYDEASSLDKRYWKEQGWLTKTPF